MGKALYRKYRSKSLSEIVGQEHITETLAKAIKSGRISHAYLLTGPRGVGKTSIARILAHEINGLPYDEERPHIDIIEIDAASNRRIDEIRELRDKIHVAPAAAKYKIYIIDEVHMLTREAFNALLKTLEEPPAHAIFILATTEAHKLPETIISRTQRYTFRPIEPAKAVNHLKSIAKQEKITVTDEALKLIAEHGNGSFRDSISLLDQLGTTQKKIDVADVQQILGMPPIEAIESLLKSVSTGQPNSAIYSQLAALFDQGYQPATIAKQLAHAIRTDLTASKTTTTNAIDLLTGLLAVPLSHDPEAHLEVVLMRQNAQNTPVSAPAPAPVKQTASAQKPATEPLEQPQASTPPEVTEKPPKTEEPKTQATEPAFAAEAEPKAKVRAQDGDSHFLTPETWQEVLNLLKKQHNTLYGIVRMAQPDFSQPGQLQLSFSFAFHQKRANEAKNRQIIGDAILAVIGNDLEITCLFDSEAKVAQPVLATAAPSTGKDESLSTISNIFGGVEMVE
jgi:DNA polymerase-3 subunit gamma/tau